MRYSTLTDINRDNVSGLTRAWTWATGESPIRTNRFDQGGATGHVPGDAVDGERHALPQHAVQPRRRARRVRQDASSGSSIRAPTRSGSRPTAPDSCIAASRCGPTVAQRRVFINSRWRLFALDASTGKPIPSFGTNGQIDVTAGLAWPVNPLHYTNTSPPVIWGDLVILGNGVGDRLMYRKDPPGDIQAFDVRTGQASVAIQDRAGARRIRQRHVARRIVAAHGPHECVGTIHRRQRARPALPAGRDAEQ